MNGVVEGLDVLNIATREQGIIRYDLPGVLSALLIPGKRKTFWGSMGDALLIDRALGIVAVADGPERNPVAAANFLTRFASQATDLKNLHTHHNDLKSIYAALVDLTNRLVRETGYHDGTTFSAIMTGDGGDLVLLHTGDSLVFLLPEETDRVVQLSRTNHCLVGRSSCLFQTDLVTLRPGDLLLLATDGLTDLARWSGVATEIFVAGFVKDRRTEHVVDGIFESIQQKEIVDLDDICIVAILPEELRCCSPQPADTRVILGSDRN